MFSRFVIYNFEDIYKSVILTDYFKPFGEELIKEMKNQFSKSIDQFFDDKNRTVDANKIENNWFPTIKCDIFISHSHNDSNQIISFVGWLYKIFGIRAFVDSTIWENVDSLRIKLEKKYLQNGSVNKNAAYEKAYTHSRLILNSAIEKMIDLTECFLFIGTKNSLIDTYTTSPWIYQENLFSNLVRRKELFEYRKLSIHESRFADSFDIKYKCSFDGYKEITRFDLMNLWKNKGSIESISMLDYLYEIKGLLPKKGRL